MPARGSFEAVFVIGLEQGSLPRRAPTSPFLDDETRRELDSARGARLQRPDTASRDRYLFYTACTRPRKLLTLVREAATDDGSPREPSPFWEAVCELFDADDVRRHTTRRPLSRLTWPIEAAPTERERLRALARLAADDPSEADALAFANGWQRKLGRARRAFSRPTAIRHPRALALLGSRETFRVTDLERMAGCSSAWFVERYLRPGGIDQAIDPMMRGSIAHVALQRFYKQLPAEIPGAERVTPANVEAAVDADAPVRCRRARFGPPHRRRRPAAPRARRRACSATSSSSCGPRRPPSRRSCRASSRSPSRATSSHRASRSAARSTASTSTRISARGIIVDYKSGAAPSATQIHDEARLQIPLYLLVLRDQLGLEPMGGVYMPLGGGRRAARDAARRGRPVPGFATGDYLDGEAFEAEIEHARGTAVVLAERIRAGDVRPRPARRRLPGLVRPLADVPEGAAVSAVTGSQPDAGSESRSSSGRDRRARLDVRLGGGRHGQDDRARRAVRPRRDRGRARRRLAARDHLHRACRRRAAGADPRAAGRARAAPTSRATSTAPGSRRSTASAAGFSRAYPLAAGIDPRFRVLDESQASVLQGEAFNAALERSARPTSPIAGSCSRPTAPRPAHDARQRLRDASLGRARADARAG